MEKFCGKIGFGIVETDDYGVTKTCVVERKYRGQLLKPTTRSIDPGNGINDNIIISNEISVLCDAYARENFSSIQYIEFMGARWKVSKVQVMTPRLILTTGGVYNGEQATTA